MNSWLISALNSEALEKLSKIFQKHPFKPYSTAIILSIKSNILPSTASSSHYAFQTKIVHEFIISIITVRM
jgi:hypothetical protein